MVNQRERGNRKKAMRLFTSECVTVGHPDKVSDYIADKLLTEMLKQDANTRAGIEVMCANNNVILGGEVTTSAVIDYEAVTREAIEYLGYVHKDCPFNSEEVKFQNFIHQQSPDIALGTNDDVGGAGDQGIMLGGAVNETNELMPISMSIARALTVKLEQIIYANIEDEDPILRPDGKSQVTIAYGKGSVPEYVDTVVISVSHSANADIEEVRKIVREQVIAPVLDEYGFSINDVVNVYINPTGRFAIYGPDGDCGVTGRKLVVDTYGSYFAMGGGAMSGKDPSKTDRSGSYLARYIAKNIVASGVANKCEVQLGYAIGVAKPVSVNINLFNTNNYPVGLVCRAVYSLFDMTPAGITKEFSLRSGEIEYGDTAIYGHFGEQNPNVLWPWEETDKAQAIYDYCKEHYVEK